MVNNKINKKILLTKRTYTSVANIMSITGTCEFILKRSRNYRRHGTTISIFVRCTRKWSRVTRMT